MREKMYKLWQIGRNL